eukprot:TRINITY_DN47_c0_g1_i2.p1 TRINITY_DN47_c0_g1~~TRINITY_DN47_c0_g1_i2.p1  ORF type:complete len:173 (+),score=66.76 TRINITY_DN47_c0_g1_i2:67-585(+)
MSDSKEELGLDAGIEDVELTLVTKEGTEEKVARRVALMSGLVKTTLENDRDSTRIELSEVRHDVLQLIVEYMQHHTTPPKDPSDIKEIAKPIRSLEMKKIVDDPWDAEFADRMSPKQIFDVILAANYLQVDPLLHLFCAKVATMIKNRSHEEIRRVFSEGLGKTKSEDEKAN